MRRGVVDDADGAARSAFEEFFRSEFPRLLNLSAALVGDRALAEDLTQEALLRAHRTWTKVSTLESPGGWTRRVLLNLVRDSMRRRERERRPRARIEPADHVDGDPITGEWWTAVRRLPHLQRTVVALHYVDDMSIADVAAVLGVSSGTVKTSLSRARVALAPALATSVEAHDDATQGRAR